MPPPPVLPRRQPSPSKSPAMKFGREGVPVHREGRLARPRLRGDGHEEPARPGGARERYLRACAGAFQVHRELLKHKLVHHDNRSTTPTVSPRSGTTTSPSRRSSTASAIEGSGGASASARSPTSTKSSWRRARPSALKLHRYWSNVVRAVKSEARLHQEDDHPHQLALPLEARRPQGARLHEGARRCWFSCACRRGVNRPPPCSCPTSWTAPAHVPVPALKTCGGAGVRAVRGSVHASGAARARALRLQRVQHHGQPAVTTSRIDFRRW